MKNAKEPGRLILTSRGLNCRAGRRAVTKALKETLGENYREKLKGQSVVMFTMRDYGIHQILRNAANELGFREDQITIWDEYITKEIKESGKNYDWCYVSEGNTFELCQMLRLTGGWRTIVNSVNERGSYMGASAGAMLAASSIVFAQDFDSNFLGLRDLDGLDLLPPSLGRTAVIPHYTRRQFERYKRSVPKWRLEEFDYLNYIPDTGYLLFEPNA